jgi:FtsP/CotA-like multicopper oxidase with cupredoxin domain
MGADLQGIPFPQFMVNDKSFDHKRIDENVDFMDVEEWIIVNNDMTVHPFHIHMNSFLVAQVASSFETSEPFIKHVTNTSNPGNRYRDTVIVPPQGFARIWMRFEHGYTGKTVYHCHFLAHEDTGMIANVLVEEPLDLSKKAHEQEMKQTGHQ